MTFSLCAQILIMWYFCFFLFFQAKIDLLLVGDVTVQYLADTVQKLFSNIAKVTITISDMKKAVAFLDECTFNVFFLKMTLPTVKELEAVKLIR